MKSLSKHIAVYAMILCSACTSMKSAEEIAPGTYRIEFVDTDIAQSPLAGAAAGDMFALKKCPNGYEKIGEKVIPKSGSREYSWKIRCI